MNPFNQPHVLSWRKLGSVVPTVVNKKGLEVPDPHIIARREYTTGLNWPKLVITLYSDVHEPYRVKIGCSQKENSNEWWSDCAIPTELMRELAEMLQEAKSFVPEIKIEAGLVSSMMGRLRFLFRLKFVPTAEMLPIILADIKEPVNVVWVHAKNAIGKYDDVLKAFRECKNPNVRFSEDDTWI